MLGARVAAHSAPACSAHAPCPPSTRVPTIRVSGCLPSLRAGARCEHSKAPPCVSAAPSSACCARARGRAKAAS
eukprot:1284455-Alexandrium_andersonii.AAC.1